MRRPTHRAQWKVLLLLDRRQLRFVGGWPCVEGNAQTASYYFMCSEGDTRSADCEAAHGDGTGV
jgi:hypothetical protein